MCATLRCSSGSTLAGLTPSAQLLLQKRMLSTSLPHLGVLTCDEVLSRVAAAAAAAGTTVGQLHLLPGLGPGLELGLCDGARGVWRLVLDVCPNPWRCLPLAGMNDASAHSWHPLDEQLKSAGKHLSQNARQCHHC